METLLQAKQIGPYVLVPAIETVDDQHKIALIFQVGGQDDETLQQIDGETVNAQLQDANGNNLEITNRPEPGLLGVRGSRSLQSTANFIFQSSGAELQLLTVFLGDDSIVIDFLTKYDQKIDFDTPPKKGERFPFRRPPNNIFEVFSYFLMDILRGIYVFFHRLFFPNCCVKRFQAPLNSSSPTPLQRRFFMEADFESNGKCRCSCCRYAQFVRGTIIDAAGGAVIFPLPDGNFDPTTYREDGKINEFGQGKHGFYGDRGHPQQAGDRYLPNQADGCQFRGRDTVSMVAGDRATVNFVGLILDTCEGTVKDVRTWTVTFP